MAKTNHQPTAPARRSVLLIGASRGLGLGLATHWARRGQHVTATVRGSAPTRLHEFAARHPDQVAIETVDITRPAEIAALRERLHGRRFELLFINAGVANSYDKTVAQTSDEDFARVMATNALGPMRVIETLGDLVESTGTIGVMSSGQGSVTNNLGGGDEVYRGSKAALNTFMRSYAARQGDGSRSLVLMAPGWVRTELGGEGARLEIDESVAGVVTTIDALHGTAGLHYVDYRGEPVPW